MGLSKEQLERYSRNIALREVGRQGQERLVASKVESARDKLLKT